MTFVVSQTNNEIPPWFFNSFGPKAAVKSASCQWGNEALKVTDARAKSLTLLKLYIFILSYSICQYGHGNYSYYKWQGYLIIIHLALKRDMFVCIMQESKLCNMFCFNMPLHILHNYSWMLKCWFEFSASKSKTLYKNVAHDKTFILFVWQWCYFIYIRIVFSHRILC